MESRDDCLRSLLSPSSFIGMEAAAAADFARHDETALAMFNESIDFGVVSSYYHFIGNSYINLIRLIEKYLYFI